MRAPSQEVYGVAGSELDFGPGRRWQRLDPRSVSASIGQHEFGSLYRSGGSRYSQ